MSFTTLPQPPASPSPYRLPAFSGEALCIPTSNSVMRLLVTGSSSSSAFGIIATDGKADKPIGFHYHNNSHDVFLCLKGRVGVWADDGDEKGTKTRESRILESGDFASIPPPAFFTHGNGRASVPGGWEETFFRAIGDPHDGPSLFPTNDQRLFHTTLLPRLQKAAEELDMVPCPQHPFWDLQPWNEAFSSGKGVELLPNALRPYFLKASTGPRWCLGGTLVRRMAGVKESGGRFTVSELSDLGGVKDLPSLRFPDVHHCFYVVEGTLKIDLIDAGLKTHQTFTAGETAFVPAGHAFTVEWASRWGSTYLFSSSRGLAGVIEDLGKAWEEPIIEERCPGVTLQEVDTLSKTANFEVVTNVVS